MAKKKELEEEKKVKTTKKTTKGTKKTVSEEKGKTTKKVSTKKVETDTKVKKTPRKVKEEVKEEKVVEEVVVEEKEKVETPLVEEPKKKSIFGVILVLFGILLIVLAFIVSVIETSEKSKFYNPISYNDVSELMNDDEINIIYWASPTCSYCSQFKPVIMDVSQEYELTFNYLNVSNLSQDDYAAMYTYFMDYDTTYESENLGTPSLILVKEGKIIDISVGAMTKDELVTYLQDKELISK